MLVVVAMHLMPESIQKLLCGSLQVREPPMLELVRAMDRGLPLPRRGRRIRGSRSRGRDRAVEKAHSGIYKGRQKPLLPHPRRRGPPYATGVTREPTGRYQGGRGSLERQGGCRRRATGARPQKDGAGGRGAIGRIKLYLVIPMQKNNVFGT